MPKKNKGYELFAHTADIGIIVRGATLEELFQQAGMALLDTAVSVNKLEYKIKDGVKLSKSSIENLFKAWLSKLLYFFSCEGKIYTEYKFKTLTETELEADLQGDIFDKSRHTLNTDLKAITYHQLSVKKTSTGYKARFIIDV